MPSDAPQYKAADALNASSDTQPRRASSADANTRSIDSNTSNDSATARRRRAGATLVYDPRARAPSALNGSRRNKPTDRRVQFTGVQGTHIAPTLADVLEQQDALQTLPETREDGPGLHITDAERLILTDAQHDDDTDDTGAKKDRSMATSRDTTQTTSSDEELQAIEDAMAQLSAEFRIDPVTLRFTDPALERQYVAFYNSHAGFAAGKLDLLVSNLIVAVMLAPYLGVSADDAHVWTATPLLLQYAAFAVGLGALGLLFVGRLVAYREIIFTVGLAVHWPAYATVTLLSSDNHAYRYAYTCCCLLFCCFVAQPRFVVVAPFMSVTPIATCFIATSASHGYWDRHSRFEMMYWLFPLFPLLILRIFERYNRDAFVVTTRNWASVTALDNRDRLTRRLIARFFPVTVARRILETGGTEPCAVYPGAALVLTNVEGFAEWAAQTSAELVVSKLASMIAELERVGRKYGVERVTIEGDRYFAAVFPTTAHRQKSSTIDDSDTGGLSTSSRSLVSTATCRASLTSTALHRSTDSPDDAVSFQTNAKVEEELRPAKVAPADAAARAHNALRFATAVRYSPDVMAASIAVHVGSVVAGIVGTLPPKIEVFGAAVARLENLSERGKRRRVHASQEAVATAKVLGRPSPDFEPSDANGYIFSRWLAEDPQRTSAASPTGPAPAVGSWNPSVVLNSSGQSAEVTPAVPPAAALAPDEGGARSTSTSDVVPAEEDKPQRSAAEEVAVILEERRELGRQVAARVVPLSRIVERTCNAMKALALEGFESRESLLLVVRRRLFDSNGRGGADGQKETPNAFVTVEEQQLLDELDEFEMRSNQTLALSTNSTAGLSSVDYPRPSGPGQPGGRVAAHDEDAELDDDDLQLVVHAGDEESMYTMNWCRMRFVDDKIEAQFRQRIRLSGMTREVFSGFALMVMFLLMCHAATGCGVHARSKLLVSVVTGCVMLHMAILYHTTKTRVIDTCVNIGVYGVIAWASALMYDPTGCDRDATLAGGNTIALYFVVFAAAPSFSLDLWMPIRFAFLAAIAGQFALAVFARGALYPGDGVLVYDYLPLRIAITLPFVSLFAELTMRHAFQSSMRVRSREANSVRHAEETNDALELLMPAFAVKRFSRLVKKQGSAGFMTEKHKQAAGTSVIDIDAAEDSSETSSTHSRGSGATRLSTMSRRSGKSGALDVAAAGAGPASVGKKDLARALTLRNSEAVWPHARAVVLIVKFAPPILAFDVIADTVARIEAMATAHDMQKVQTAGTTVKLVGGIDSGAPFEVSVANAMDAALEIQRRVFPPRLTEGWRHSIALHCGPVFSAMIGTHGLTFGVYGDTVNTARAVCDAAPSEAVYCTLAVCQAVPRDETERDFHVTAVSAPLAVKGKGSIAVYRVHERGRWGYSAPNGGGKRVTNGPGPIADTASLISAADDPKAQSFDGGERTGVAAPEDPGMAPSEIAESIRSSLRSAALLPTAAASVGLLAAQLGFLDGAGGGLTDSATSSMKRSAMSAAEAHTSISEAKPSPGRHEPLSPGSAPPAPSENSTRSYDTSRNTSNHSNNNNNNTDATNNGNQRATKTDDDARTPSTDPRDVTRSPKPSSHSGHDGAAPSKHADPARQQQPMAYLVRRGIDTPSSETGGSPQEGLRRVPAVFEYENDVAGFTDSE